MIGEGERTDESTGGDSAAEPIMRNVFGKSAGTAQAQMPVESANLQLLTAMRALHVFHQVPF